MKGLVLFGAFLAACAHVPTSEIREFEKWREKREASLRSETGYLALAGLYWLEEGSHTFGSNPSNDLIFPEDRFPATAGVLRLSARKVFLEAAAGVQFLRGGEKFSSGILDFDPPQDRRIVFDGASFWAIERAGQIGIRLRDPQNPILQNYRGTPTFPYQSSWEFKAKFHPEPKDLLIPNILGSHFQEKSPGHLVFEYRSQRYRLEVSEQNKKGELFIVFGDETNGGESYGGGRFILVPAPNEAGETSIDFNRAYNPPCAYSPYTTCPKPPAQNILPFRVEAGERGQIYLKGTDLFK